MSLTWKWLLSSLRPHARVSREDVVRAPDVGHLLCSCPQRLRSLYAAEDRRGNDAVRGGPDDGCH